MKYLERYEAPAAVLVAPSPSEGMFLSGLKIQISNPMLMAKVAIKQDYAVMFSTPALAKKFLFSHDTDQAAVAGYCSRFGPASYLAALETIFNLPKKPRTKSEMLVVGAENDAIIPPAKIEKTARKLGANCRIFSNIAHDMMLERNWNVVAAYIADWLETKVD